MSKPTVLVACCKQKHPRATNAAHLYTSDLFKKSRAYAERFGERWFILSARHHVLSPEEIAEPYNDTLNDMEPKWRRVWANCVRHVLLNRGGIKGRHFVILAGEAYREHLTAMIEEEGGTWEAPMAGLGIGQQKKWLAEQVKP